VLTQIAIFNRSEEMEFLTPHRRFSRSLSVIVWKCLICHQQWLYSFLTAFTHVQIYSRFVLAQSLALQPWANRSSDWMEAFLMSLSQGPSAVHVGQV